MFQSARELSEHTGKRLPIDRRAGHLIVAGVNSVQIAGGSQPTGVTGLLWQAVKNGAEKIWNFIN